MPQSIITFILFIWLTLVTGIGILTIEGTLEMVKTQATQIDKIESLTAMLNDHSNSYRVGSTKINDKILDLQKEIYREEIRMAVEIMNNSGYRGSGYEFYGLNFNQMVFIYDDWNHVNYISVDVYNKIITNNYTP